MMSLLLVVWKDRRSGAGTRLEKLLSRRSYVQELDEYYYLPTPLYLQIDKMLADSSVLG